MLVDTSDFPKKAGEHAPKKITVLGSTGSVGESTLGLIAENPERFSVFALVAGSSVEKLALQAKKFSPKYVALADQSRYKELVQRCSQLGVRDTAILTGEHAIENLAREPQADLVVAAIVGLRGLKPILSAMTAGKTVALANKESLICAGSLIKKIQEKSSSKIIPVDSEHSAIFQLLLGYRADEIESITLTASGGPFLKTRFEDLKHITRDQALRHPRWQMGEKITIDSATLVNKALEVIEAHLLFDMPVERILVVIHPQSIVHGLISLRDGAEIAHLSNPDMRGALAFALSYPAGRMSNVLTRLDLSRHERLEFLPLDGKRFPAIEMARKCIVQGAAACSIFSIANEAAVEAFLAEKIPFSEITGIIQDCLEKLVGLSYSSVDDLFEIDSKVRKHVFHYISANSKVVHSG